MDRLLFSVLRTIFLCAAYNLMKTRCRQPSMCLGSMTSIYQISADLDRRKNVKIIHPEHIVSIRQVNRDYRIDDSHRTEKTAYHAASDRRLRTDWRL